MSTFHQTNKSDPGAIIRRVGTAAVQWSKAVLLASGSLEIGEFVTLDATTGEIKKKTAATEVTIGFVLVKNTPENDNRATVQLAGAAIITAGSTAAIGFAAYVSSIGVNTTVDPDRPNAVATATGQFADGIALTDASGGDELLEVLVLASPVLLP